VADGGWQMADGKWQIQVIQSQRKFAQVAQVPRDSSAEYAETEHKTTGLQDHGLQDGHNDYRTTRLRDDIQKLKPRHAEKLKC
jgi:hypothetical protein